MHIFKHSQDRKNNVLMNICGCILISFTIYLSIKKKTFMQVIFFTAFFASAKFLTNFWFIFAHLTKLFNFARFFLNKKLFLQFFYLFLKKDI